MRPVKIEAVADALCQRLRSVLGQFSPPLLLVEVDDFWGLKRSIAQIGTRVPAIIFVLAGIEFDTAAPALRQKQTWVANYVWKLNADVNVGYRACEKIAEQFTDEQYESLTLDVPGLFVESVVPAAIDMSEEFVDLGLGHGVFSFTVNLHSVSV